MNRDLSIGGALTHEAQYGGLCDTRISAQTSNQPQQTSYRDQTLARRKSLGFVIADSVFISKMISSHFREPPFCGVFSPLH